MKTAQQDLTTGPLGKQILVFSIPLILSNLLQVLFNMADVAVVGRFAGSVALGAVGYTAAHAGSPDALGACPAASMCWWPISSAPEIGRACRTPSIPRPWCPRRWVFCCWRRAAASRR